MNGLFRVSPRVLAAGITLTLASFAANAAVVEFVVTGEAPPGGHGTRPDVTDSLNYISAPSSYNDIEAIAMLWDDVPIHTGDEMRLLLSFDAGAATEGTGPCGGTSWRYGGVTGSLTVAGVAAVLDAGAEIEVFQCSGLVYVSMMAPASGPSLTTSPWWGVETESAAWRFPPAQMPMQRISFVAASPQEAACVDGYGALPTTTDGFIAACASTSPRGASVRWENSDVCSSAGSEDCGYRAYYEAFFGDGYGVPFSVSVPTTEDYVDQLVAEVLVLNLDEGIQNSLDAKIAEAVGTSDQVALATYATTTEKKNEANASARNRLGAFINAVNAQRGKAIPDDKAERLVELAERLAARL